MTDADNNSDHTHDGINIFQNPGYYYRYYLGKSPEKFSNLEKYPIDKYGGYSDVNGNWYIVTSKLFTEGYENCVKLCF